VRLTGALSRCRRRLVLRLAGILVRRLAGCVLLVRRLASLALRSTGAGLPLTRRRLVAGRRLGTGRSMSAGRRRLRLDALARLLAQPAGDAERRHGAHVDAAGHGDPLLTLIHGDGFAGLRTPDAVGFTMQHASLDQHALNDADVVRRKIDHRYGAAAAAHAATMTGAGEAGARTDRNHVDDAAIAVDDHHLVLHDEEAIVAIGREHVDQRRIGRDRGDGHARRDGDAGANLEVDRARVDMRNVARLQNRLLQRRALLRRHVLAALGLDLAVGRGLALGLTLRVGLALGRVLVGAGVRIPVLSALAGSALLAIGPAVSLCIGLA